MGLLSTLHARRRLALPITHGGRARLRALTEPEPGSERPSAAPSPAATPSESDAPSPPGGPAQPPPQRTRLLRLDLGTQPDGEPLQWDSSRELNSFVVAVGASGSGKTQLLRLFAEAGRKANLPVILVDVHGDLASPRLSNYRIGPEYSLNPLEGSGSVTDRTSWITAPIEDAAELGHVQSLVLRDAVSSTLQRAEAANGRPTLAALKQAVGASELGTRASVMGLRAILEQLFEPSAFGGRELPLRNLLYLGGHLDLTGLSPRAQLLVTHALLAQVWAALVALGPCPAGRLRALLVLDEAARLRGSALLDRVVRESRKFGLGLCIASQLPEDLSEAVRGNAGTAVVLRLGGQRAQESAAQLLGGLSRQRVAELSRPGDAWVRHGQGVFRVQLHLAGGR